MQKKAIRIMTRNKWNSHTATLYKNSNILRLPDINRLQVGCFVYQAFRVICRSYLTIIVLLIREFMVT